MSTIEIRNSQNVAIDYELASLRDRIVAFGIDLFMVGVIYFLLLIGVLSLGLDEAFDAGLGLYFLYLLAPIFILLGYHLGFELWNHGQTPGKQMMAIRVIRLDGKEPSSSDFLLRAVFLMIDVLFSLGTIAALLVGAGAKRQRLGDLTANTTVVRLTSSLHFQLDDLVRIEQLKNQPPTYPQVRQLSEAQMLLIKNTLNRCQQYSNAAHQEVLQDLVAKLTEILDIREKPANPIQFLKTLIRDYIVLTR